MAPHCVYHGLCRVAHTALTKRAAGVLTLVVLAGCGTTPPPSSPPHATESVVDHRAYFTLPHSAQREEVVLFAYGLLNTGYRFGGRNPEAGLDCSGMVSHIVENVSGQRLPHNAAQIAKLTRPIAKTDLKPGDLVFFNTLNRPFSHMGVYLGEGRFVHAPSRHGRVRIARLDNPYFSKHFEAARSLLAPR